MSMESLLPPQGSGAVVSKVVQSEPMGTLSRGNPWKTSSPWHKGATESPPPATRTCATCKTPGELIDGQLGLQLASAQQGCLFACQGCLAEHYCCSECWVQDHDRHKQHCHFAVRVMLLAGNSFEVSQCWDSMTVYELKLRIWRATNIRTEQMMLMAGHQLLEPQLTLRDACVLHTREVALVLRACPAFGN